MAVRRQERAQVLLRWLLRPREEGDDPHVPVGAPRAVWMDAYVTAERRGPDSLRRFLLDLDAKEASQVEESRSIGRCWSSTLRSTPTRAMRAGLRRRPMNATSGRSAIICSTGRDAALRAVRWRRRATRWRSPLYLWRASIRRRLRGHGVRTCCLRVCPSRRESGVERALGRVELGRLVLSRARDPDQRMRSGQRAARQSATLDASRRHRICPRATPPRAGVASWALSPQAVEAIRAQMLLRVNARREISGNETRWS